MNYTIKIWNINSKGKEKIIDIKTFDNRLDAETFISENKEDKSCCLFAGDLTLDSSFDF